MIVTISKQIVKTEVAEWHWFEFWFLGKKDKRTIYRTRIIIAIFGLPIIWYTKDEA